MFAAQRYVFCRRIIQYAPTSRPYSRASAVGRRVETRNYEAAIVALNTLQSNHTIVELIRKYGKEFQERAIPEMKEWCRKIGHEPSDFDRLRLIHISGTKGKGSTSAFISSILAQYLPATTPSQTSPRKIGLYTSPHLRFVRERIQINNEPISEEKFAKYFFELWDRWEAAARKLDTPPDAPTMPVYFHYLTLMALHAYLEEGVDSAIVEAGIGGEYDTTNILTKPSVTAVTSLGIDHIPLLGSTIPQIAWHKGGIFKPGIVAFSSPQKEEGLAVLNERAAEKGTKLHLVGIHPDLANDKVKLHFSAGFQKVNASLAIAVAAAHLRDLGHSSLPDPTASPHINLPPEFVRGLEQARWPGRCDVRRERNIAWHIDGAHTMESIEVTGRWFAEQITTSPSAAPRRILIFNQQTRDAHALAKALFEALRAGVSSGDPSVGASSPFAEVIFCTNQTFNSGYKPDLISLNTDAKYVATLEVQNALAKTWNNIDPQASVRVCVSIEDAVAAARKLAASWTQEARENESKEEEVMALVTGSLHLVGGAIDVLESS